MSIKHQSIASLYRLANRPYKFNVPNRGPAVSTRTFKTKLFQVTRTFRVGGRGEVRWVEERNTTR